VIPLDDPLRFRPDNRTLAVVSEARAVAMRLRDDAFDRIAWPKGMSRAWRELAISILHEGLLRPLLDITDAKLDAKTHVEYTADQADAIRQAQDGTCQAAFLIAPTTPAELQGRPILAAIEVYPHPALVVLLDRAERLPYKAKHGRTRDVRHAAMCELVQGLERFKRYDPPLDVTTSPRWSSLVAGCLARGSEAATKRVEDELDAYVCAYIGWYHLAWAG